MLFQSSNFQLLSIQYFVNHLLSVSVKWAKRRRFGFFFLVIKRNWKNCYLKKKKVEERETLSVWVEQSKENMKKGKEPMCSIDFWMQETVKELTTCVYFICAIWSPIIKESDSGNHIDSTSSRTFAKTSGCKSRRVTI